MNKELIINSIEKSLDIIKCDNSVKKLFELHKNHLIDSDITILTHFSQVKKNSNYSGLMSESLFVTRTGVIDFVVGENNIELSTITYSNILGAHLHFIPLFKNSVDPSTQKTIRKKIGSKLRLNLIYNSKGNIYYEASNNEIETLLAAFYQIQKFL